MRIAAQRLVVEWTTESRGSAGASRRNAVPSSLALPTLPDADGTALVHLAPVQRNAIAGQSGRVPAR